jgi:hypothetical protein
MSTSSGRLSSYRDLHWSRDEFNSWNELVDESRLVPEPVHRSDVDAKSLYHRPCCGFFENDVQKRPVCDICGASMIHKLVRSSMVGGPTTCALEDRFGNNLLHHAAAAGNTTRVMHFLFASYPFSNSDINHRNTSGETFLHVFRISGPHEFPQYVKILRMAYGRGFSFATRDYNGRSIAQRFPDLMDDWEVDLLELRTAAKYLGVEVLQSISDTWKLSVDVKPEEYEFPFYRTRPPTSSELLLYDLNSNGDTRLISTLKNWSQNPKPLAQLEHLIKESDIHMRDARGYTPLAIAARCGLRQAVLFLLERGANPNTRSYQGTSVITRATSQLAQATKEDNDELYAKILSCIVLLADHGAKSVVTEYDEYCLYKPISEGRNESTQATLVKPIPNSFFKSRLKSFPTKWRRSRHRAEDEMDNRAWVTSWLRATPADAILDEILEEPCEEDFGRQPSELGSTSVLELADTSYPIELQATDLTREPVINRTSPAELLDPNFTMDPFVKRRKRRMPLSAEEFPAHVESLKVPYMGASRKGLTSAASRIVSHSDCSDQRHMAKPFHPLAPSASFPTQLITRNPYVGGDISRSRKLPPVSSPTLAASHYTNRVLSSNFDSATAPDSNLRIPALSTPDKSVVQYFKSHFEALQFEQGLLDNFQHNIDQHLLRIGCDIESGDKAELQGAFSGNSEKSLQQVPPLMLPARSTTRNMGSPPESLAYLGVQPPQACSSSPSITTNDRKRKECPVTSSRKLSSYSHLGPNNRISPDSSTSQSHHTNVSARANGHEPASGNGCQYEHHLVPHSQITDSVIEPYSRPKKRRMGYGEMASRASSETFVGPEETNSARGLLRDHVGRPNEPSTGDTLFSISEQGIGYEDCGTPSLRFESRGISTVPIQNSAKRRRRDFDGLSLPMVWPGLPGTSINPFPDIVLSPEFPENATPPIHFPPNAASDLGNSSLQYIAPWPDIITELEKGQHETILEEIYTHTVGSMISDNMYQETSMAANSMVERQDGGTGDTIGTEIDGSWETPFAISSGTIDTVLFPLPSSLSLAETSSWPLAPEAGDFELAL